MIETPVVVGHEHSPPPCGLGSLHYLIFTATPASIRHSFRDLPSLSFIFGRSSPNVSPSSPSSNSACSRFLMILCFDLSRRFKGEVQKVQKIRQGSGRLLIQALGVVGHEHSPPLSGLGFLHYLHIRCHTRIYSSLCPRFVATHFHPPPSNTSLLMEKIFSHFWLRCPGFYST